MSRNMQIQKTNIRQSSFVTEELCRKFEVQQIKIDVVHNKKVVYISR